MKYCFRENFYSQTSLTVSEGCVLLVGVPNWILSVLHLYYKCNESTWLQMKWNCTSSITSFYSIKAIKISKQD